MVKSSLDAAAELARAAATEAADALHAGQRGAAADHLHPGAEVGRTAGALRRFPLPAEADVGQGREVQRHEAEHRAGTLRVLHVAEQVDADVAGVAGRRADEVVPAEGDVTAPTDLEERRVERCQGHVELRRPDVGLLRADLRGTEDRDSSGDRDEGCDACETRHPPNVASGPAVPSDDVGDGRAGAAAKSSPMVYATGKRPACMCVSYGMPSRSAASRSRCRCSVVHAEPRPRERRASMKLHTAGRIDPQRLAWSKIEPWSVRPATTGTTSTGTSCRCSRRWNTDALMRCAAGDE